jgi:hypothetical protein
MTAKVAVPEVTGFAVTEAVGLRSRGDRAGGIGCLHKASQRFASSGDSLFLTVVPRVGLGFEPEA